MGFQTKPSLGPYIQRWRGSIPDHADRGQKENLEFSYLSKKLECHSRRMERTSEA